MKKAIKLNQLPEPWATMERLSRSLRPVTHTGQLLACCRCNSIIRLGYIYFVDSENVEGGQAWCRTCAIAVILALRLVDVETAFSIPVLGPIPQWMLPTSPMHWPRPPSAPGGAMGYDLGP